MAMQFFTNLNLNKNEIQNAVLQPLAVEPSNPKLGQIYFKSVDKFIYRFDGTKWGKVGVVYNHAGTTGAVIVGLDENGNVTTKNVIELTLTGYTPVEEGSVTAGMTLEAAIKALDQAIKTAGEQFETSLQDYVQKKTEIDMGSHKIKNLTEGTEDTDAVNYKQLQDAIAALGNVFDLKGEKDTVADLPTEGNKVGDVWYVKEDSAGHIWLVTEEHPSGYWEPFGPAINLSGYLQIADIKQTTGDSTIAPMSQDATTKAIAAAVGGLIKVSTGTIGTTATSAQVAFTGNLINAYVKNASGEIVMTDITVSESKVTFTTSAPPESVLTCTVVSA